MSKGASRVCFAVLIWCCCLIAAMGATAPTEIGAEELLRSYRLTSGDRLSVQVYREPELSKEYAIASNGRISFPFLGEVEVAGKTAVEISESLVTQLRGSYLIDPKVTVTVVRYRPVYLSGEVKTPGAHDFEPGLTVLQAISLAGGFTERASRRKIYLISGDDAEGTKPRRVALDHPLRPGDTITVEESFF